LPVLQAKEVIEAKNLFPKQHFTQPPPRYSEATLIKILEENGIGRPSTYAPILDTIVSRGYVIKQQKQCFPTELGFIVVDLLKSFFPEIINIEFTANLEGQLDSVELGEADWKQILKVFYGPFQQELEVAEKEIGQIEIADEETDQLCENCGRNMVIKMGRFGKFLACPGFPECRNTKPLLEETGVACPKCEDGKVVVRASRKGRKFYGCSNYPKCDYVSWDEPADGKCPQCSNPLLIKRARSGDKIICSNKECSYEKEMIKVEG
jgi:DNA topoisomerase-1